MQSITFAYPSLSLPKQDQIDVTVNQATAAIVCSYLEYMGHYAGRSINAEGVLVITAQATGTSFITISELSTLVNTVQGALRTVP